MNNEAFTPFLEASRNSSATHDCRQRFAIVNAGLAQQPTPTTNFGDPPLRHFASARFAHCNRRSPGPQLRPARA
jgi:hypothetical protein